MSYKPGPWTIEEYGDDETPSLVIHKDTENRVCFMATPGSRSDPKKIEADARLIAAAPDLLAALTRLSNEVLGSMPLMEPLARRELGNTNYSILIQRAEEARAAIAKAKGEA